MQQMAFDDKQAWTNFKNSENFKRIILIFYGLWLLSLILGTIPCLGHIASFLMTSVIIGYFLNVARTRVFKPDSQLPEYDWKNIFIAGVQYNLILTIVNLPMMLIMPSLTEMVKNDKTKIASALFIAAILFILSVCIFIYFATAVLPYITNFKFNALFNMKAIKCIVKNEYYVKYLCKIFNKYLILFIFTGLLLITFIGIIAVPYVMFKYLAIISEYQAQFIRQVFKIGQN